MELDVCGNVLELELDYDIIIDFHPMTPAELARNRVYFNEIKKGF